MSRRIVVKSGLSIFQKPGSPYYYVYVPQVNRRWPKELSTRTTSLAKARTFATQMKARLTKKEADISLRLGLTKRDQTTRPYWPQLEELLGLLRYTTHASIQYLLQKPKALEGLLSGGTIETLWNTFTQSRYKKTAYGLYFLFYQLDLTPVPLYVGKGQLPGRLFDHFSGPQFLDQLLAHHFGGIHGQPHLLATDRRLFLSRQLLCLRIGLILLSHTEEHQMVKDLESAFQRYLEPVCDGRYYEKHLNRLPTEYRLPHLTWNWIKQHWHLPLKDAPDLNELRWRHDNFIGRTLS